MKLEAIVRMTLAGATIMVCVSGSALASDAIMSGYFGNTVISKGSMGESHTHYNADHTFDVTLSTMVGDYSTKGTWKFDDKDELCRTYEQVPSGMPNPSCIPWEAHKPGDVWTVTFNGQQRQVSMVAGIK